MAQLHDLAATEQAAAVRQREVSPVELVDHYLDRIGALDADLGAFITVTAEAARGQAKEAERAVRAGAELPPLHGVPIAIKDLNLTAGVRTTMGSAAFADFVPPVDDYVVAKLRAAGTISLGKTNTPEMGLPCYTEPKVAPPARCAWDLGRYAGGSSGGAAAAVAGGLLPFAQGSDGGGSIRIPASINGLFGVKPSRGLVSPGPVRADVSGLSTDGPIARTVRDAAALLDAMAGVMPGDLFTAPGLPAGERYVDHVDREPGRLRIGRYLAPVVADVEVHPEVRAAWEDASELLASLGHEVVDAVPPVGPEHVPAFEVIWAVAACGYPIDPALEGELLPLTRYLRARGGAVSGAEYLAARAQLQLAAWAGLAAARSYDVLLSPTLSMPPRPLGWFHEEGEGEPDFERQKRYAAYTAVYNVTGQPAVSVPLYWTGGAEPGLPIGSMLVGRHGAEATLLSLSAQLEAARPWRERHPTLW
ncbi:MAG: amidase [Actinobacteria bacterium]|nr:amidase [Actinomycetota bacterium]MBI3688063.1 amidase [Actinomycetota bacterium]